MSAALATITDKSPLITSAIASGLVTMFYVAKYYLRELRYEGPGNIFFINGVVHESGSGTHELLLLAVASSGFESASYHIKDQGEQFPIRFTLLDSNRACSFSPYLGRATVRSPNDSHLVMGSSVSKDYDLEWVIGQGRKVKAVRTTLCYTMKEYYVSPEPFTRDFEQWRAAGVDQFIVYYLKTDPEMKEFLHGLETRRNGFVIIPWPNLPDLIKRNPNFLHDSTEIILANHCLQLAKASTFLIQVSYDDFLPSADAADLVTPFINQNPARLLYPDCVVGQRRFLNADSACETHATTGEHAPVLREYFERKEKLVRLITVKNVDYVTGDSCTPLGIYSPLMSDKHKEKTMGCPEKTTLTPPILKMLGLMQKCLPVALERRTTHHYADKCGDSFDDCLFQYCDDPCITMSAKHYMLSEAPHIYYYNDTFDVKSSLGCRYSAGVVFSEFPMIQ